jgi:thiol-disulfide isomerase/thioredoxin
MEALALRLKRFEGSPAVVYLWAPWSRSAVELTPTMAELNREYGPLGVEFLAVLLDAAEPPDDFDMPCFVLEGDALEALERFGVSDVPAVLTLSAQGSLMGRVECEARTGRIDPAEIVDAIESAAPAPL